MQEIKNKKISNGLNKLDLIFKILIFIILLLTVFILLTYFFSNSENRIENVEQNNTIISPITNNQKELIKEYLKNNISELSPEKEVLGGKFYITNISFIDGNNLIVDYEDGHIALKSNVKFEINKNNHINIFNFVLLK